MTFYGWNDEYWDDEIGGVYPTGPWGRSLKLYIGPFALKLTQTYSKKKQQQLQEEHDREQQEFMDGLQVYINAKENERAGS